MVQQTTPEPYPVFQGINIVAIHEMYKQISLRERLGVRYLFT